MNQPAYDNSRMTTPDDADALRREMHGAPALLALPTDRARTPQRRHDAAVVAFELPPEVATAVRRFGVRHGVATAATMLSAWAACLARMGGQQDIVIGIVSERFGAIPFPLRFRIGDDLTVAGLLQQAKDALARAGAARPPSLEALLAAGDAAGDVANGAGHHPLCQAAMCMEDTASASAAKLPSAGDAPVDLLLSYHLAQDGADVRIAYALDLFEAASVQRLASCYRTLLQGMIERDGDPVCALALLDDEARKRVLFDFNDTGRDFPRDQLIHRLFEQTAAAWPDAIALVDGGERVTYDMLNRRANRLAHCLIAQGVGPDERVAVCAWRSAELVIGMLAILKAGGAYVPLDPGYPEARLTHMLDDCAPKALLVQPSLLPDLPAGSIAIMPLDTRAPALAGWPDTSPDPASLGLSSSNLAYVIYTSGSTGLPKGVMVEHRSVMRLVVNNPYVELGPEDCVVHCANPAFDAATWELWATLLHGARLLVVRQATLLSPSDFKAAIEGEGATVLHLTVGIFNQYADSFGDVFRKLKYLMFGGDQSDPRKVMQVHGSSAPRHMIHCYGPTETTTFATTQEIGPELAGRTSLPIGKPIANTRIYILDSQMAPVPIGVEGEICIGGAGVVRGYLNRADLSAERFIPDPFGDVPSGRLYRTGDLGRWLPDGSIEYCGRTDFQVKIRGFRVEPGEIEARLAQHPRLKEVVVLARDTEAAGRQLVAYFTVSDGDPAAPVRDELDFDWSDMIGRALGNADPAPAAASPLRATELADYLKECLPDYMVPAAYVQVDVMPLTPNGKLDRNALPAPQAAAYAARQYEMPQGPIESAIAGLWAELLGTERVGRHDDFAQLGGHSLLAVQMASRLNSLFGTDLSLHEIGALSSVGQLAALICAPATA